MIEDEELDALRAIADRIRGSAEFASHGYFPGGDPREFSPDEEMCTAGEIEAWKAACAAWERGECVDVGGPHVPFGDEHVPPEAVVGAAVALGLNPATASGHVTVAHFGMGTYVMRDEDLTRLAQDLDDWIDRARNAA